MFLSPRIGTYDLVQLCQRVGNQLQAGVDARRIWRREAERAHGRRRHVMETIADSIERGTSTPEAIHLTGEYFPEMFRQMVDLGDATGHLDRIFLELAEQYDHQLRLRREFLKGITWPMIQLVLAILIVGGLIYFMGVISDLSGQKIDILGLGLVGAQGAAEYFAVVGSVIFAGWLIYLLWSRGKFAFLQLDRLLMAVPGIGPAIRTLALSRMAWAMSLTLSGGMEIRQAMRLSLQAARSRYYSRFVPQVDQQILRGDEVHESLRDTGAFPAEFLDVVETGEMAGTLAESMDRLAVQYQEKAKAALNTLAIIGGVIVWMMVAGIIIALIFKLAMFYLGTINEALEQTI